MRYRGGVCAAAALGGGSTAPRPRPTTDLAATAAVRALRASLLLVPAHVREAPPVRDARARAAGLPPDGRQPGRRRLTGTG